MRPRHCRSSSKALLREPGGFEGGGAIRKPLLADDLALAKRSDDRVVEHDPCAARLSTCLSPTMGHNLVAPGVDDLGVIRDQPEGFGDTQIELPDSLAPTNHTDFRPVPIRDDLTGWIATGEKCSPIAAIKGFEVLTRTDRVLLRHRLRSIPWLLLPMQSRSDRRRGDILEPSPTAAHRA